MNETSHHIITSATASGKWGGFITAGFGALSFNEQLAFWGFIVGVIGTIANVIVNYYFKHKAHKLAVKVAGMKDDE